MEVEKRYMPIKWILLSIVVLITVLLMMHFVEFPVHAAEVIPSGDLREAEAVIATWDNSTLYAPEPYFTNSLTDTLYPGETVYYGGYAALENSKIRFRYEIHGEQYTSFFPEEVMCTVFASDGTVLDHRYVKNEFSIYDYAFSRGYLGAWSDNLVYVNTDLGYSFADLDVLGISGRVLYFSVYRNQVDHYYAAQISSGTFSIVDSPDSSLYNILSSELSSNISLFSWNSDTREWDLITANASESVLNAYPVDKVLRLQGTSALYFKDGGFTRLEPVYFREDSVPPDPELPGPGSSVVVSYLFYQESGYYLVDLSYVPSSFEADLTTTVSSILASSGNLNRVFTGSGYLLNASPGTYSGSSASNKPLYNVMQYVFTASSVDYVRLYSIGSVLPTSDVEWLKANYSYSNVSTSMTTIYDAFRLGLQSISMSSGTVYSVNAYSRYSYSTGYRTYPFNIVASSASVKVLSLGNNPGYDVYNNAGSSYVVYWGQWFMLGNDAPSDGPVASPSPTPEPTLPPGVSPTPTPDPNATPTPTPPTVIIQWPTNTPTPTPFPLDFTMPTLPGGDLSSQTTDNVLSRGLEQIRLRLNTGLLAAAFSYVPPELQFLIWFLVFVLLLLAVVKLIIHFGG